MASKTKPSWTQILVSLDNFVTFRQNGPGLSPNGQFFKQSQQRNTAAHAQENNGEYLHNVEYNHI